MEIFPSVLCVQCWNGWTCTRMNFWKIGALLKQNAPFRR